MLTKSGLGALVTAVVLAITGWWWNYEEVVVAAIAVGAVLLMGMWVSQRPLRATVTRRLQTVRVPRGDPVVVHFRLRNSTRFRSGRADDHRPMRRRRGADRCRADRIQLGTHRDRRDPDAPAWRVRRRTVRDRAGRPVLAHGRPAPRQRTRLGDRPSQGLRPGRTARCRPSRSRTNRYSAGPPPTRCRASCRCASTSPATTRA